eukprot:gene12523-biopygen3030
MFECSLEGFLDDSVEARSRRLTFALTPIIRVDGATKTRLASCPASSSMALNSRAFPASSSSTCNVEKRKKKEETEEKGKKKGRIKEGKEEEWKNVE